MPAAQADLAATLEAQTRFDLVLCAQPIGAATLIVAGARDRFYSPELFRETAALVPGSHLRMFPRRGHLTVLNDRRARATVAGFLAQPGSSPLGPATEDVGGDLVSEVKAL